MKLSSLFLSVALLAGVWPFAASADDSTDQAAIHHLLNAQFDKPEARLAVDPIAIEDGFAVAGWTQGDMGGRAFLRKKGETWTLVLCSGDALKEVATLTTIGVPADAAERLAAELAAGEKSADPARVALFSRFEGMVMMDEHGGGGDHQHATQ